MGQALRLLTDFNRHYAAPLLHHVVKVPSYDSASKGGHQLHRGPLPYQPAQAAGLTARRQLNALGIFVALALPVALFVATFQLMSSNIYYRYPEMSILLLGLALFIVLVIGTGAIQAHKKQLKTGERSWWSLIFFTSLVAVLLGASLGYVNFVLNTQHYYDYMSLRRAVDVNPGQNQGKMELDAGEIDFKQGTKIDLKLSRMYYKSSAWCVAPLVSGDGKPLASYDFWAVGKDCCTQTSFSCAPIDTSGHTAPAGIRVMSDDEIAGYKLAVEQASAAYNIQSSRPIFLYMTNKPYALIKQHLTRGNTFALYASFAFLLCQGYYVFCQAYIFGKRVPSGYMNTGLV